MPKLSDDEAALVANAQGGMQGLGPVVEAMLRLKQSTERLTRWLIGLTWVLVVLTVVIAGAAIIAVIEGWRWSA
jgi:hypothetical protein